MKLVTFSAPGADARCGALLSSPDEVLDLEHEAVDLPAPSPHVRERYDSGGPFLRGARERVALVARDAARRADLRGAGALRALADVRLGPPVPRPGKVLCIGLNYRDHAEESGLELPERPLVFSKFPSCVVGPEDPVRIPPGSTETDYEAELAVVIGRTASRVAEADAGDHVLGYCAANDVSARDFQFADGQWQRGKSCDTFCPLGPFVATADDVPDPHRLRIALRLDGETLQDSNTDQLVFGVPAVVAAVSAFATLEPGDVILTGTPPGVGFARKPPVHLRPGQRVEVEIEGLGVLANPVTD